VYQPVQERGAFDSAEPVVRCNRIPSIGKKSVAFSGRFSVRASASWSAWQRRRPAKWVWLRGMTRYGEEFGD
jgi:hypothetical protein